MNQKWNNPSGFPENLPQEQILEEHLKKLMRETYESFGYVPLETPAVEYLGALTGHGEVTKEVYAIARAAAEGEGKEDDRGLRFDLTVPLARYVAQHYGELSFPFKRYQIQKVWRGERPQKGRFREFYQADIDVIGNENLPLHFDAEVVAVMHSLITKMSLGNFTIHINHRKLLQGLLQANGIAPEQMESALRFIDKFDKVGHEATVTSFVQELGLTPEQAENLLAPLSQSIPIQELHSYLQTLPGEDILMEEGKHELGLIADFLSPVSSAVGKIVFNPRIARGLGYYTGCVYETTLDGLENYGSICSGGRYANLAERFTKKALPGVGISLGLSRLFSIIKAEKLLSMEQKTRTQVLIALFEESQRFTANSAAQTLREMGIAAEVYHDGSHNLGRQIKQADDRGIPHLLLLEEDGGFTLKNLAAHTQERIVSLEEITKLI